ncbi:MAG: hypothetical protein WBD20_17150 [Pirellulaceae bacterium]
MSTSYGSVEVATVNDRLAWKDNPAEASGDALRKLVLELTNEYADLVAYSRHRVFTAVCCIVVLLVSVAASIQNGAAWSVFGASAICSAAIVIAALGGASGQRTVLAKTGKWLRRGGTGG